MRERRYHRLVDRFQYKLATRMTMYWLVYQFTLFNFLFCWRLLRQGPGNIVQQYGQFFMEFYPMLFCFLLLVPAFLWDAIKFYHRVAGPIVRFRQAINDVASDRPLQRVRLRDGDELLDLRDDFNAMLESLARRGAVTLTEANHSGVLRASSGDISIASCDPADQEQVHVAS